MGGASLIVPGLPLCREEGLATAAAVAAWAPKPLSEQELPRLSVDLMFVLSAGMLGTGEGSRELGAAFTLGLGSGLGTRRGAKKEPSLWPSEPVKPAAACSCSPSASVVFSSPCTAPFPALCVGMRLDALPGQMRDELHLLHPLFPPVLFSRIFDFRQFLGVFFKYLT